MDAKEKRALVMTIVPTVALFIFVYPRFLIQVLGEANPWTSYLYQYSFGLVFFAIGILLILKTKACQPGRGYDRRWFRALIGGFVFFASVHAIWILMAIYIPYKGG